MSDAAESKTAAAGRANNVSPDPAAAEPCGCGERITTLEGRMSAYEGVNRAMSFLMVAVAVAVLYLVWTAPGGDKK